MFGLSLADISFFSDHCRTKSGSGSKKIKATKEKDKDEKAKDHCGGLEKHSLSSGHGREQGNEKL